MVIAPIRLDGLSECCQTKHNQEIDFEWNGKLTLSQKHFICRVCVFMFSVINHQHILRLTMRKVPRRFFFYIFLCIFLRFLDCVHLSTVLILHLKHKLLRAMLNRFFKTENGKIYEIFAFGDLLTDRSGPHSVNG